MNYTNTQLKEVLIGKGCTDDRNHTVHLFRGTFDKSDLDNMTWNSIKTFIIENNDIVGTCYAAAAYILDNAFDNYYLYGDISQGVVMVYNKN